MTPTAKVRTCLWFETGGLEAAQFYVSLLPDSAIERTMAHGRPADDPMVVEYRLGGAPMMHLTASGGGEHALTPGTSISVLTKDQAETDRLWEALIAGGSGMACAWLTDRFGVCWQIVPEDLPKLLSDPDPERAARAMQAMMKMVKIDIPALHAAADGP